MDYVLTLKEMKDLDTYNIENYISSLDLMENAGKAIFEFLTKVFYKTLPYLVVTGSGNNGGDGFVLARLLFENGYNVKVLEASEPKCYECIKNKTLYKGEIIKEFESDDRTIIVDAIFGNGLSKKIEEPYLSLMRKINNSVRYKIVSIDIASGISTDEGNILGYAIKSDLTLAIGDYKLGHFYNDGKDFNKKVVKLDIGLKDIRNDYLKILSKDDLKGFFTERKENSNKGTFGRVAFIGGKNETIGALDLAHTAYSSLKLGVGYSTICYPSSLKGLYLKDYKEITYLPLKSSKKGKIKFNKKELNKLLSSKVIALGMGIGIYKDVYKIIKYLLKNYKNTLIIDADGLNVLSKYGVDILRKERKCQVILTPHIKEFSRLIKNDSIMNIKNNRIDYGKEFVKKHNVGLILKDNVTTIFYKDQIAININGNNGLAKGGSGDILSGILAGTLSIENENIFKKMYLASYLLGRSADILKENENINTYSILPSDTLRVIHVAINELL